MDIRLHGEREAGKEPPGEGETAECDEPAAGSVEEIGSASGAAP